MRVIRWLWNGVALLVSLILIVVNLRFYRLLARNYTPEQRGPDVLDQLHFLRTALERGTGKDMQSLFPEGFFFTYALYGLAWVEVGLREPLDSALRAEALRESRWALAHLDEPEGTAPFSPNLNPPYGVFYVGWSNWLRGGTLLLEAPDQRDSAVLARFNQECETLAQAFEQSSTPFLSAYPSQAWPVDSVVGIAALRLNHVVSEIDRQPLITCWLELAQQRLDPATGLLPHRVDPQTGHPLEGARGSSLSIIMRFLPEIDPVWANEQYLSFRRQFVGQPLVIAGIREYPQGVAGRGDVDSGPLIFGISASATVVTMGAALANGDRELGTAILSTTEAFGLPFATSNTKRYAFGLVPVGDAFLVWAKTARHWTVTPQNATYPQLISTWWRVPFHLCSILLILLLWLPWYVRRRKRKPIGDRR